MSKLQIKNRWNGAVLFEGEAESIKELLQRAVREGAGLQNADLSGARLDNASLVGARLDNASLDNASLDNASLDNASLDNASLVGARLDNASLVGARLAGAYLAGADLAGANLAAIKSDLFKVLDAAPKEVAGLLRSLRSGKVDGSTYQGDCACLVGTLANVRGVKYDAIPDLIPNGDRPAERWFLAIRKGDRPGGHAVADVTERWILEWLAAHEIDVSRESNDEHVAGERARAASIIAAEVTRLRSVGREKTAKRIARLLARIENGAQS